MYRVGLITRFGRPHYYVCDRLVIGHLVVDSRGRYIEDSFMLTNEKIFPSIFVVKHV